jgi:antitoxin StbD
MRKVIPISDAEVRLAEIVRDSASDDVVLMRHGRPAAVVMSFARHEALVEKLEDMADRLFIHERDGLTMDYDRFAAELGLDEEG